MTLEEKTNLILRVCYWDGVTEATLDGDTWSIVHPDITVEASDSLFAVDEPVELIGLRYRAIFRKALGAL